MAIDYETKAHWKNLLNWINDIPLDANLILYPLQLANAIRITSNDAVFIFDEVGCGKTISSAIMAKTYLTQNKDKNNDDVLVITTNAVKFNKQFENDFKKIDVNLNPMVFNNDVRSDLKKDNLEQKKWGLAIIDEAHEFSNEDTQRFNAIKNHLKADKVVFLTATPLRKGKNFTFYKELAAAILGTDADKYNVLDELQSEHPEDLICSKFDPTSPVTRYFKDTLRYLDIHEKKENAHRVIPEIWEQENFESREDTLARMILKKLKSNNNSKFVIFVNRELEARFIEKIICEKFKENGISQHIKTIFADEKDCLKDYATVTPHLPTVLIINYQIGEAGVNLPGYDHVIHWHISHDPAKLEQRYGRIDRLTSSHHKIYSCFVIPNTYDTNLDNLHSAIEYTMNDLLTTLPARNVLLTENTLRIYKKIIENYPNDCQNTLNELSEINLRTFSDQELIEIVKSADSDNIDVNACPLYKFVFENKTQIVCRQTSPDVEDLRSAIQETLDEKINRLDKSLKKLFDAKTKESLSLFEQIIKKIKNNSDQIFYLLEKGNPLTLQTVDSQYNGCAKYILSNESYIMLQDIVRFQNAIREILQVAYNDTLFAADLFLQIGDIHSFTDELPSNLRTPSILAYKYKR